MIVGWTGWVHCGKWTMTIMRKVTRKGKVNGYEASDALAMLGTNILVAHVLHEQRKLS